MPTSRRPQAIAQRGYCDRAKLMGKNISCISASQVAVQARESHQHLLLGTAKNRLMSHLLCKIHILIPSQHSLISFTQPKNVTQIDKMMVRNYSYKYGDLLKGKK